MDDEAAVCFPKFLPNEKWQPAAAVAVEETPRNAPPPAVHSFGLSPQRIALLTTKYWGAGPRVLTVSFLEPPAYAFRLKVLRHMNAWRDSGSGVSFRYVAGRMTGTVRITTQGQGYWSYVGTDIRLIPPDQPTMSLQGFGVQTADSEYARVVRHETGHTLGFPHEHMRAELVSRLDRAKTIAWGARYLGWDERTVVEQILTPLDQRTLLGTPADQDSIMCYQLPGMITTDGQPIRGGVDINTSDAAFAASVYKPR